MSSVRRTLASERVLEVNAFGFLRLLLAGAVIVSNSWTLGGYGAEPLTRLRGGESLGFLAVTGFFGLSGALVTLSAERLPSANFLWHRARRILPGYWACLLLTAFLFGAILCWLDDLPLSAMTTPPQNSARSFVINNFPLQVNQYGVGYTLQKVPYDQALNGSLWSLPYEFFCYLIILGGVRSWQLAGRSRGLLLAFLAVSLACAVLVRDSEAKFLTWNLPLLGALDPRLFFFLWVVFLSGGILILLREHMPCSPLLVGLSIVLFCALLWLGLLQPYGGLLVPYVVLGLGRYAPAFLRRVGQRTDLSYGIYLYGFPLGQVLVASDRFHTPWTLALATLLLSLPAAALSWFGVERLFLAQRTGGAAVAT